MTTLSIDEIAAINRREERIPGTLQWRLKYKVWSTAAGVEAMRWAVQRGNDRAWAYKAESARGAGDGECAERQDWKRNEP